MAAYNSVLEYIEEFWDSATTPANKSKWGSFRNLLMHIGRIDLPNPIVSPNHQYFAGTQYYWDSYFTIIGLIESGRNDVAKGMVDNLIYLHKKFGFFPARNSITSIGRTQPPLFTSMVWEVYDTKEVSDKWLDEAMQIAVVEYNKTWTSGRRIHEPSRLSRYRPQFLKKLLTVYESGWDVSSRFAYGNTNLLPVDLNCMLHKYEVDIVRWHALRGKPHLADKWKKYANVRKRLITDYFWDDNQGFFYDFDVKSMSQEKFATLAGFMPLWCGAATKEQAEKCTEKLPIFLQKHGLASSQQTSKNNRQWDYPNGWAPLQLFVVDGLRNYGYFKDANEITNRWMQINNDVYEKTKNLWEKYDVVTGDIGLSGRYKTQPGFSWTNGVYLRLSKYDKTTNI